MLNKLIKYFINNAFITVIIFIVISIISVVAIFNTPIDALPDLSENQVVVMTRWPGQTPTNIEDQVTYPITIGMQGLAGVRDVRAMSQLGISMVTVIFNDNIDEYFARDRVNERLSLIKSDLPPGVEPVLGPDATGLGQIFMYTLESEKHDLTELRTLQDFYVKLGLQSVPGVAEVASIGGYKKNYQIIVDPLKLSNYNVSLKEISSIVSSGNNNVSGRVIDIGGNEIAIEGVGFIDKVEDLENSFVKNLDGIPIKLGDIAEIKIGSEFRRGILADEKGEKVGGVIVMRYKKNPLEVIENVKKKIAQIEKSLPDGVKIVSFYDRTNLIKDAISTLNSILTSELIITLVILFLFLWNFGASLITAISLVVGVLITFLSMKIFDIPSNIMSLGGIAIAIGTMVDAAIVVTENAYNRLLGKENLSLKERSIIIAESTKEVGGPLLFAILIIILSFIPIFALQGQEGKLFSPLAFTNMFAMLGALFSSLFLAPVLCIFFLKGKLKKDSEIPVVAFLQKLYEPLLIWGLNKRKTSLVISMILLIVGIGLFTRIGSEFMPPLDEGSIMYMPMTVPDVSDRRARELLIESNRIISEIPEVEKVVGKAGRSLTATDPAPLSMFETIITLKPKSEWRKGVTKRDIVNEMNRKIKIDKLWNGFTQPIIGRIDMLSTGIRAQVGIKIFGADPIKLEELAVKTEELMGNVPGGFGVTAIRTTGLKYLEIELDENKLLQYNIHKGDVLDTIAVGVGGKTITTTISGREKYGVELRLNNNYRESVDDIKSLLVPSKSGNITLSQIAKISIIDGPATINSENGVMRSAVQMNVQGIDLVNFVDNGKKYIEENLKLPEGYYVEWTGQYENQLRAKNTLTIVVPTVILIILFILFLAYRDIGLVSIVATSIPFSLIGGVIALYISGFNFSVAVSVGFISLFGNAVETGVVMILYLENSFREKFGLPLMDEKVLKNEDFENTIITKEGIHFSVVHGAMIRLRPVLMTAFTSVLGLFPMIWSTGTGSELQKPLAIVVVGGLITSIALTLFILPILFSYLREKKINI
ncbi:MAG: CusA/CzcA family heavy metal efflux RND transporter [Candidatus Gracilibacteria bacterium]|nr:CusA/CzcA family heavy metal efflux RND transporter [Candidatus Gracilibacteria bacterium]